MKTSTKIMASVIASKYWDIAYNNSLLFYPIYEHHNLGQVFGYMGNLKSLDLIYRYRYRCSML